MPLNCRVRLIAVLSSLMFAVHAHSQFAGARGGVNEANGFSEQQLGAPALTKDIVQGYITVEGRAEVRVPPTEIRIVLAVTAEAETPQECQAQVEQKISELRNKWREIGVSDTYTEVDFIAILPRYKFELQEEAGNRMAMERKSGYLLQSNLHVAVRDDQQALAVLRSAFSSGVADIIAFDYWNNTIEQLKKQARSLAIAAAKEKSEVLLSVFDVRPPLINIAEATQTIYPDALYQSVTNSHDDEFYGSGAVWRDIPVMRLFRPKNTYYRGLFSNSDVLPKSLPMKSEISVVSSVKLFYESPIAKEYVKLQEH